MSQILDPVPNGEGPTLLCSYINVSNQIQVARITNIPNWYFERVVFPGQRLVFEALPHGVLEIHSGMMASAILSDSIPCTKLRIQDPQVAPNRQADPVPSSKYRNRGKVEAIAITAKNGKQGTPAVKAS